MSLSSLYNQLHEYEYKVDYWQASADEYQRQINEYTTLLNDRNAQMKIAVNVKAKCDDLTNGNSLVRESLTSLGSSAAATVEVESCTSVLKISDPNEGNINNAITLTQALIDKLQAEIDDFTSKLDYAVDGKNYSDGRVSYYQGCVSDTRQAIANYDEDDD